MINARALYNLRRPSINELLLSLYDSALQSCYKLFDSILTDNGYEFQKLTSTEFTPSVSCVLMSFTVILINLIKKLNANAIMDLSADS